MKPSLLSPEAASRFYMHWLNADQDTREKQLSSTNKHTLSELDFAALLQNETSAGFTLNRAMRRVRNLLVASIIRQDLAGKADLSMVLDTISRFAEFAIQTCLAALTEDMIRSHGEPVGENSGEAQELIVVGMGKLGGSELNVSSDVDLIFIYPESGQTRTTLPDQHSLSNQEFFTRLGQRLIQALSDIQEDGFVFRVDMALRPHGGSGPLVCNFNALEHYLIVQGREWERYAWVKGRVLTGNRSHIAAMERIVQPFVYRRYLDYGVIDAIRSMHQQVRAEVIRQEKLHPERSRNIKLGRGGIREIEFLTQIFQLIRGGRDVDLRNRSTRAILKTLVIKNQIDADISEKLLQSYTFLRNLEHRLQYLDDAQTHTLPASGEDMGKIALSMGYENSAELLQALQQHRDFVAEQFDAILSDKTQQEAPAENMLHQPLNLDQPTDEQMSALSNKLRTFGFAEPEPAAARLLALWKNNRIQSLSDSSRDRLMALINLVLPQMAGSSSKPVQTLNRILDFFESIARRAAYLSLLTEYPAILGRLIRMMDASDWAAQYLTRHPILLDELIDVRTLLAPPDWALFEAELAERLALEKGDTERQMDILREMHHAQQFRLLAQDLEGVLTVEHLADHLSKLADIMVEAVIREAWQTIAKRHTEAPRFAVIAYGKLGGKELGYASDLDVVFLYEDADPEAPVLYARLAQRFITWMTSPTSAGRLFDVDIALRPDGASGLMVCSVAAFAKYQQDSAWTWEHQALTRARFCAGDETIGRRFEAIREAILTQERDDAQLKEDVLAIREKMHDAHPNRSSQFDVKHDPGGMIDIEFAVQYLVLKNACRYPELTGNIGNIALLILAEKLGLIEAGLGSEVADIYRDFRRKQHQLRMQGAEMARTPVDEASAQIATVKKLWTCLFG